MGNKKKHNDILNAANKIHQSSRNPQGNWMLAGSDFIDKWTDAMEEFERKQKIENREKSIEEILGNMDNLELIERHQESTKFCSLPNHMRESSETYDMIIEKGNDIISDIILYMKNNSCGMSIILLLEDIVDENPYDPKNEGSGFVSYNVEAAVKTWIDWGEKNNYI